MDDRAVFTAIVFVLTSGCAWRYLPPSFGVTVAAAHRGSPTGPRPACGAGRHRAVLAELCSHGLIELSLEGIGLFSSHHFDAGC